MFFKNDCCWINEVFSPSECLNKATDIESACLACPDDFLISIESGADGECENGYVSNITLDSGQTGFYTYDFAVKKRQDFSEVLNYDSQTAKIEDDEKVIFTLCADTPDKLCQLRSMQGREIAFILKLKDKTGDYQFVIVNALGGMKVTEINGAIKQGFYEVTVSGKPNARAMFIDAGGISATEDLVDSVCDISLLAVITLVSITQADDMSIWGHASLDCDTIPIETSLSPITMTWVFTLENGTTRPTATITGVAFTYTVTAGDVINLEAIGMFDLLGEPIEKMSGMDKNINSDLLLAHDITVELTISDSCGTSVAYDTIPKILVNAQYANIRDIVRIDDNLYITDGLSNNTIRTLDLTTGLTYSLFSGIDADPYGLDFDDQELSNGIPIMYVSIQNTPDRDIEELRFLGGDPNLAANWSRTSLGAATARYRGMCVDRTRRMNGKPMLWAVAQGGGYTGFVAIYFDGVNWIQQGVFAQNSSKIRISEIDGDIFMASHSNIYQVAKLTGADPLDFADWTRVLLFSGTTPEAFNTTGDLFAVNREVEMIKSDAGDYYLGVSDTADTDTSFLHKASWVTDILVPSNWQLDVAKDDLGADILPQNTFGAAGMHYHSGSNTIYVTTKQTISTYNLTTKEFTIISGSPTLAGNVEQHYR